MWEKFLKITDKPFRTKDSYRQSGIEWRNGIHPSAFNLFVV